MGKIFDALEKSKKSAETLPATHPGSAKEGVPDRGKPFDFGSAKAADESSVLLQPVRNAAGFRAAAEFPTAAVDQAQLPEFRPDKNLIALSKPRSYEAEQFKILRNNLLFPAHGAPARSLMVTSALAAEGKSFVAANLAISIAQNINEHVLLIDCDLRKPSIDRMFGLGNPVGLSEYLRGSIALSTLLVKSGIEKLKILAAGQPPHNPAELLSSQKMLNLLSEVKERYADRYVILDSPPPRLTAEANAIAKQVDGILIVVKSGSTPRMAVKNLVDYLEKEKIVGITYNGFDARSANGTYKKYDGLYADA